ncbi:hypothetical protein [Staphylococcus warneri]|uniref:hypothetical protein n=1 Tax=Staphylococcus warneri TaxID=1292 RepID=UPI0016439606|nr:hypothetical protein [Staphylococcus warneri]
MKTKKKLMRNIEIVVENNVAGLLKVWTGGYGNIMIVENDGKPCVRVLGSS